MWDRGAELFRGEGRRPQGHWGGPQRHRGEGQGRGARQRLRRCHHLDTGADLELASCFPLLIAIAIVPSEPWESARISSRGGRRGGDGGYKFPYLFALRSYLSRTSPDVRVVCTPALGVGRRKTFFFSAFSIGRQTPRLQSSRVCA